MSKRRGLYSVLVGKLKEKRQLGRTSCRLDDNIKIDFKEVGCGYTDWIDLPQGRDS
jgi:hypothetical protein